MIILLSPAKTLDLTPLKKNVELTIPIFNQQANQLNSILKKKKSAQLKKLMGISDQLAALNVERNQQFSASPLNEQLKQAVFMFKGDVYIGLQIETFSDAELLKAQEKLRILSGLYGLLKPLDGIQAYRLEMGTELSNKKGKNLYSFWGDSITKQLNKELTEHKYSTLINLASNEYFSAVKAKKISVPIITPRFLDMSNGSYKMISFFAKKARGLMALYIIKNNCTTADDLIAFNSEGYMYNESLSKKNQPTFTRG
jgi:cytoplasmic iron level regulating protein YaaA (DUF328/UPF0246 family)